MPANDIEKKTTIKQAARTLFFQFGYSKTAMNDIARQSGLAKPTLYYYYPSKEAIFDEIVLEEANLFMDTVEESLAPDLAADEKLGAFFRQMYQNLKEHKQRMADIPRYLYEHSPHGHPIIEKLGAMVVERLLPILEAGNREGVFQIEHLRITAATLVFATEFLNLDWMHHYPEDKRDQVVDTLVNLIVNGLRRKTQ